jgi:hypothetical protein
MASSVGSRPTHYDALGLKPTASQQDIADAFGRAMGMFGAHPLADAARIGAAFEVLRDPERRRAYDEAMGLRAKPKPQPQPRPVFSTYASQWNGAGFIGSGWKPAATPAAAASAPDPAPAPAEEPRRTPEPAPALQAEAPGEPRVASFIAESLRDIARPAAVAETPAETKPAQKPAPRLEPVPEAKRERVPPVHFDELPWARGEVDDAPDAGEPRPIEWKRIGMVAGGLVLGAGLIGALAGSWVKDDVQAQAEPAVSTELPAAKPAVAAPASAAPVMAQAAQPEPQVRAAPVRRAVPAPKPRVEQQVAQAQPLEVPAADVAEASAQLAADPLAPQPVAVPMPLPNAVVARTIERIGYSCGEVASTSPMGGDGVFKVTCTSGQSYRAAPVHGRYRFKRL